MKALVILFSVFTSTSLFAADNFCSIVSNFAIPLSQNACLGVSDSCFIEQYNEFLKLKKPSVVEVERGIDKCKFVSDTCFAVSKVVFNETIEASAALCKDVNEHCFKNRVKELTLENAVTACKGK